MSRPTALVLSILLATAAHARVGAIEPRAMVVTQPESPIQITKYSPRYLAAGKADAQGINHRVEYRNRRNEEHRPRLRCREVQQPIVQARRFTDEHAPQHPLDHREPGAVPDDVGADLTRRDAAERHVVPQDVELAP